MLDWTDRSTAVLFGDGAAGVLIEAAETPHFLNEKLQADGQRWAALTSGYTINESPFYQGHEQASKTLQMDGRGIFDFAIKDVSQNILSVVTDETVDYHLLHQANERIVEKIARKTRFPATKFLTNMAKYGNTSAASIPILLDEAVEWDLNFRFPTTRGANRIWRRLNMGLTAPNAVKNCSHINEENDYFGGIYTWYSKKFKQLSWKN